MRITFRKQKGKRLGRYTAYCTDQCGDILEVYVPPDGPVSAEDIDKSLYEIGDIIATRKEWRELFTKVGII